MEYPSAPSSGVNYIHNRLTDKSNVLHCHSDKDVWLYYEAKWVAFRLISLFSTKIGTTHSFFRWNIICHCIKLKTKAASAA